MATPNIRDLTLEYWEKKWEDGTTGWHNTQVDSMLKKYLSKLTKEKPSVSILVTFCGKSVDLPWLCEQGHIAVGAELSEKGAINLFQENQIPYSVSTEFSGFKLFTATDRKLKFFVGDFYNLTPDITGVFDGIWDHNALGAVSPSDRVRYVEKLRSFLTPEGRIFLSNYEYDQKQRDIAPYSLPTSLVEELFGEHFEVELLERMSTDHYPLIEQKRLKFNFDWLYRPIHLLSRKS